MFFAFCDGGSRGNPGSAAIGVVIKKEDEIIYTAGEYIGIETNNVAEYKGLIKALEILKEVGATEAKIHLDSELVVKQVNGIYKVKNPLLQKLFSEVLPLMKIFDKLEIVHVRREYNKEADALVNQALDSKEKGGEGRFENFKDTKKEERICKKISSVLEEKLTLLNKVILSYKNVVVAYSGGIDSSLLSFVAMQILGDKSMAVTIVGEQTISKELDYARAFVKTNNINHHELNLTIFDENKDFYNGEQRCYYCKKRNFEAIKSYASKTNSIVLDGTNIDDLKEYRPGLKALEELDIKSPFVEAGISKKEIIELCNFFDLNMSEKDSNTCLITRIPVGEVVTKEKLARIDICEAYLKTFAKGTIRLRDFDYYCVIEAEEDKNILDNKEKIRAFFISKGYKKIYLDICGYKQGSMEERVK